MEFTLFADSIASCSFILRRKKYRSPFFFFFYLLARNKPPDRKRSWHAQVFSRFPDSASFIPVSPGTEMRIPFFRSDSLEKRQRPSVSCLRPLNIFPIFSFSFFHFLSFLPSPHLTFPFYLFSINFSNILFKVKK